MHPAPSIYRGHGCARRYIASTQCMHPAPSICRGHRCRLPPPAQLASTQCMHPAPSIYRCRLPRRPAQLAAQLARHQEEARQRKRRARASRAALSAPRHGGGGGDAGGGGGGGGVTREWLEGISSQACCSASTRSALGSGRGLTPDNNPDERVDDVADLRDQRTEILVFRPSRLHSCKVLMSVTQHRYSCK